MNTRPILVAGALAGLAAFPRLASAQHWTAAVFSPITNWGPIACSADGSKIVAAVGAGRSYPTSAGPIYVSSDRGGNWNATSAPVATWTALASSADGSTLLAVPESGAPHISTDAGNTWVVAPLPATNWDAVACSADGLRMLAAGSGHVYQSTNAGAAWVSAPGLFAGNCMALSACGRILVVGQNPGSIYTFTNNGAIWSLRSIGPYTNWISVTCSADGRTLVAASSPAHLLLYPGEIFTSGDYGATWQRTGSPGADWRAIASSADGAELAAISVRVGFPQISGTIFVSTNSGATWTNTLGPTVNWQAIASSADGSLKWATTQGGVIYYWETTPAPVLKMAGATDNVTVAWIIPSGNFALQQNPDLTPGNWSDVSIPPTLDYDTLEYTVSLPVTGKASFYRLIGK